MEKNKIDAKIIREIKGIVYLSVALFLFLSLISYHPLDPSFTHFAISNQTIHNFTGKVGSYTADSLIRLLGAASLLFPLVFLICSFQYFLRPEFMLSKSKLTGFVFFVLSFAGIMALLIQGSLTLYGESLKNGAGGLIGVVIVKMLRAYFNLAGTYIILFLIFIIALTFIFEFSMVSVTERISLFLLPFSIFLKTEFLLLSVTSRAVKKKSARPKISSLPNPKKRRR